MQRAGLRSESDPEGWSDLEEYSEGLADCDPSEIRATLELAAGGRSLPRAGA